MKRSVKRPGFRLLAVVSLLPLVDGCDDSTQGGVVAAVITAIIAFFVLAADSCAACWNFGAPTAPRLTDAMVMVCDDGVLEGFVGPDEKKRAMAWIDGKRAGPFSVNAERFATFTCTAGKTYTVRFE